MLSVRVLPRRGVPVRALLATAEIMTLLVAAHTVAGGALPAAGWMVLATGLVLGGSLLVVRGRAPLRIAVPALIATQLLLHSWMEVLAPSPGHAHGAALGLTWQMLLAHLVVGVVTALVWELRRRAVEVLLGWSTPGLLPPPGLRRVGPAPAPVLPLRRPLVVVPLRGPPVGPARPA